MALAGIEFAPAEQVAGGAGPREEEVARHEGDDAAEASGSDPENGGPHQMAPEALFQSLAKEPYETLFALTELNRPAGETCEASDIAPEGECIVRNLDSGEARTLSDGALDASFVGGLADPKLLAGRRKCGVAWQSWWDEKRQRDESLWRATQSGDLEQLKSILKASGDGGPSTQVNSKSLYGRTALHMAAEAGNADAMAVLLEAGADVEANTDDGLTALHVACQRGHADAARLLLDRGVEPCAATSDGSLAVHLAAFGGHVAVLRLLLERGGREQLRQKNGCGQRPREVACIAETAKFFLECDSPHATESTVDSAGGADISADGYAGRTLFCEDNVLLNNARRDAVLRLLIGTQGLSPASAHGIQPGRQPSSSLPTTTEPSESEEEPSPISSLPIPHSNENLCPVKSGWREKRARQPFQRLRKDSVDVEEVGPEDFVFVKLLGQGSFGQVFQVKHRNTGQDHAMKLLKKSKIARGNLLRYALTERNVLSCTKHPYIVSLHYAFQTPYYLVMVLQFCEGGNLQAVINRERRLRHPLAQLYSAEILLALVYLHRRQIVYRDLKPENVVIDGDDHCKLTDFGLSKENVFGFHGTTSFCGSIAFLAPEILQRRGHGHPVDIYGLGVLLYDMLTGLPPFYHQDRATLFTNIRHSRLSIPSYVSRAAGSLIEGLMEREPTRRLGAQCTSDIQTHVFFSGIDFEALMRREVPVPSSAAVQQPLPWNREQQVSPFGVAPDSPFIAADRGLVGMWRGRRSAQGEAGAAPVPGWEFSTPFKVQCKVR